MPEKRDTSLLEDKYELMIRTNAIFLGKTHSGEELLRIWIWLHAVVMEDSGYSAAPESKCQRKIRDWIPREKEDGTLIQIDSSIENGVGTEIWGTLDVQIVPEDQLPPGFWD